MSMGAPRRPRDNDGRPWGPMRDPWMPMGGHERPWGVTRDPWARTGDSWTPTEPKGDLREPTENPSPRNSTDGRDAHGSQR